MQGDDAEDSVPAEEELARKGLPEDWSLPRRDPVRLELPRPGWLELLTRYAGMGPSDPLDEIFRETVGKQSPTRVVLEADYIDEDYRDEYSHFYAKTYRQIPSRCERLHFYREDDGGERYLGFVVIRPIIGRPVSRTMLSPPEWVELHVSCLATGSATVYGFAASVRTFPFISQDAQFGSCSHAAIWMIALYFHLRFARPRFHLSDLAASAAIHQDLPPSIPSAGLTPRQISAVLHDLKMPPVIYRLDRPLPPGETVETIVCRYLNSGLPVMLLAEGGVSGHARVLIGYGRDKNGRMFFVEHDDQAGPYLVNRPLPTAPVATTGRWARLRPRVSLTGTPSTRSASGSAPATWDALIVPLPGRIYLSGEGAEKTAALIFEDLIDRNPSLARFRGQLDNGRLRLRSYLIESAEYKRALRTRGLPADVVTWHVNTSTSHWLWVVELQDRDVAATSRRCVVGEVAIDATSDEQWVNPLFANLPGLLAWWPELADDIDEADSTQGAEPYLTGCALHAPS